MSEGKAADLKAPGRTNGTCKVFACDPTSRGYHDLGI
jgi:hypothetical protein